MIGGGYVALECAGFLTSFGKRVTLINRSTFLRNMDRDMTKVVMEDLEKRGVLALENARPLWGTKIRDDLFAVRLAIGEQERELTVNTILLAIGREANFEKIGLNNTGVKVTPENKIAHGDWFEPEQTNVEGIHAIGDVLENHRDWHAQRYEKVPELQPVARRAGKLLAHRMYERLYGNRTRMYPGVPKHREIKSRFKTDYTFVPTTIFTPTEYSFVGFSEEDALKFYGPDNVEVYRKRVVPPQYMFDKANQRFAYLKLVCLKRRPEFIKGLHYFGPHAEEVVAPIGMAMKWGSGVTKEAMNLMVGIHPSVTHDFFEGMMTEKHRKKIIDEAYINDIDSQLKNYTEN